MLKIIDIAAAKSSRDDSSKWLSFRAHALDTADVLVKLFYERLSDSERTFISSNLFPEDVDPLESEEKTVQFCKLLGLLHDIGKLTFVFQSKIAVNIDGLAEKYQELGIDITQPCSEAAKAPHNVASQIILKEYKFPDGICGIVGAHHGMASFVNEVFINENFFGKHTVANNENKERLEHNWREAWNEWIDFSLKYTGFKSITELPKANIKTQMLLTGLLIMSDWISSNMDYFPLVSIEDISSNLELMELNINRVEQAWNMIDFPECWQPDLVSASEVSEYFKRRFSFEPNSIQCAIMKRAEASVSGYGLYILEAPMGIGKTEAALATAEIMAARNGQGGLFFGLPTQATANGVFSRVHDWINSMSDDENYTIRLAHGMTDLNEEYQSIFHGTANETEDIQGAFVHKWFEGRKQALLSDFVVATVDQFLLASLKQKHVMLRHLGLAGKVVVIDECHAYSSYMNVYLDHTLTWMGAYKVPVVLLSATLPPNRRKEFIEAYLKGGGYYKKDALSIPGDPRLYPALTWTDGESVFREKILGANVEKKVVVTHIKKEDVCSVLEDKLSDGGCAAIIVNTVGQAQQLARMMKNEMKGFEVICFHSRFVNTDRAEIERHLIKKVGKHSEYISRDKVIVVGTQVMEQSLDIDFDYMITEICPMDLLLQRIGRLHRHKRWRPEQLCNPEIGLMMNDDAAADKVYSKWILYRTQINMPEIVCIPNDIPLLVSKVYAAPSDEEVCRQEYEEYKQEENDKKVRAEAYCIDSAKVNMRRSSLAILLANNTDDNVKAEASVRDAEETLEVVVMSKRNDGKFGCVSQNGADAVFDSTISLTEEQAIRVARERVKLPAYFARYYFDETEKTLNQMPVRWQESPYLRGELLMLLDEHKEVTIVGKKLKYDNTYGLIDFMEGGKNEPRI